jgi:hypothetical protein
MHMTVILGFNFKHVYVGVKYFGKVILIYYPGFSLTELTHRLNREFRRAACCPFVPNHC